MANVIQAVRLGVGIAQPDRGTATARGARGFRIARRDPRFGNGLREPGFGTAVALALASAAVVAVTTGRALLPAGTGRSPPTPAVVAEVATASPTLQGTFAALPPAPEGAERAERAEVNAVVATAARKYRVAHDVMRDFVSTAFVEARRNRLDPLLVVAVMGVESRFNPVAQSEYGATGLMQVIPRYHTDKFSPAKGESVLDPRTNIRVGTRALREYVARAGTEAAGLQLYNGASSDPRNRYAAKVLAERARLREAVQRGRSRLAGRVT